ncbi:uncharacterized protein CC84DRAFT_1210666 [Paraphaeosphaeria sporulosa]|uniref:Carboxylic ester hydrolase n=1 Tax=Paraphaeosphaeria sporulosa TaxID=1460663 RepID=A0A177BWX4_9PLEO|nr:uncharacterized protein CC84DRAFT_1210666 [Paraphaeosphaeria sporulosa]OAF98819.1 hypothetical protein CC84DRAFT_1210666 [Paraphaeosphaeria sporulosa]
MVKAAYGQVNFFSCRLLRESGVSNNSHFDLFANNFQMRTDWGHVATYLAAVISKKHRYRILHSGYQSLLEAQRYPEDFNGRYATEPALNETGVTTYAITSNVCAVLLDKTNFTQAVTVNDVQVTEEAVLGACGDLGGVEDGVIGFLRSYHFKLDNLACSAPQPTNSACLSATALRAAELLYTDSISSITNQQLNVKGVLPGSESSWPGTYVATTEGGKLGYYAFALRILSHYAIIMTQDMSDISVAPNFALDLYRRSEKLCGATTIGEWFRFFEIPGVTHGRGSVDAETFFELDYLVKWVEEGEAPNTIVIRLQMPRSRVGGNFDPSYRV